MNAKKLAGTAFLIVGLAAAIGYVVFTEDHRQVERALAPIYLGNESVLSPVPGSSGLSPTRSELDPAIQLVANDGAPIRGREPVQILSGSKTVVIRGEEFTETWIGDLQRLYRAESGILFSEGRWRDGKRTGLHRSWQKSGWLADEVNWIDGLRDGDASYFSSEIPNTLVAVGRYEAGFKTGEWIRWYHTGELMSTGSYVFSEGAHSAVKLGSWARYLMDGSVDTARSGFYRDGKIVR